MIHVNQDVAIHGALGIDQTDAAGEVFWNLGPGVFLMCEFLQRHAERFIVAFRTQGDQPCMAVAGKCLGHL